MNKTAVSGAIVAGFFLPIWGAELGWLTTRGLYGSLEFGYTHDEATDPYNETRQNTTTQNYVVGTRGFVYSPNLISYQLEGGFAVYDTKSTSSGVAMDSSSETLNYNLNAEIIRSTNYPFSLYNQKSTTPYSSVSADTALAYEEVNERTGISGNLKLPYALVSYRIEMSDMSRDESYAEEVRDNQEYMVSVYKDYSEGRVRGEYIERERDYLRDDRRFSTRQEWSDHSRDARASWSWNVDKTLRLDTSLNYMQSSYAGMSNLSGGLNVDWRPEADYNAGMSLMASTMESDSYQNDTYTLNGYSSYRVTPEFSTTQNVSLYAMRGDLVDQTMETATLGGSYMKAFGEGSSFNSSVSLMARSEQNDVAADSNVSMPDRETYGYSMTVGGGTRVDSIRSNLSASLMYDSTQSTLEETTDRFSARIGLVASILYNLTYTLSISYIWEESDYLAADGMEYRQLEVETCDNAFNYWQDVGYNGKVSLNGGVAYTLSRSDQGDEVSRTFPHANGSFNYRFWNGADMVASLSASQDTVSDLTNYSGYVGLNYAIRQVIVSLGSRYLMQTGGSLEERAQRSYFFKIRRTF